MSNVNKKIFLGIFVAVLFLSPLTHAVEPHRSIEYLVSSNGLSFLSFDLEKGYIDQFKPHLVDPWDVGQRTVNLVKYIDAQIVIEGKSIRLSRLPIAHSGYINGTGIIRTEYRLPRLHFITYIWSPMIMEHKAVVYLIQVPGGQFYSPAPADIQFLTNSVSPDVAPIRTREGIGAETWVGQIVLYTGGLEDKTVENLRIELGRSKPNLLLQAEERWWDHWHRQVEVPASIYDKKYDLLKQSAAFIKMAQVREPGPSYGQIVNSLSPRAEKKAVVRDMAYATVALARLGYVLESRAAIAFMLEAKSGRFASFRTGGREWGMGRPYAVSLGFLNGMGYEETEFVEGIPQLYFDGQGLFLWAFSEYMKHTTDFKNTRKYWPSVTEFVVEPLMASIDKEGLIRPDCGWWDAPFPGEHFTYTSLAAYKGLNSASMVAHMLEYDAASEKYLKTAADLRANILTKLTVGKSLMMSRSLETKAFPQFLDASVVEAVNWRIVDPQWKTTNSISQSLAAFFQVGDSTRGYSLGFIPGKDKLPESCFISLRAYNALRKLGEVKRAQIVFEWVLEQAVRNSEIIPEFFDPATADYRGAYPLVGLGAGAYILSLFPK